MKQSANQRVRHCRKSLKKPFRPVRLVSVVSVFLALSLFLVFFAPIVVLASDSMTKTIKVGAFYDIDYMHKNDRGEYVGYIPEYLQTIEKYSDCSFEYVECYGFSDAMEKLAAGKIDLMGNVFSSPERIPFYDYSHLPMGIVYSSLSVKSDNESYAYDDFEVFKNLTVGILHNSKNIDFFNEYCNKNGIKANIKLYENHETLLADLDNEKIDAVVTTGLGKSVPHRVISRFSPMPIYFATTKGKTDIINIIDSAMVEITLRDPGYLTNLYDKYFSATTNQTPVFTKEEQRYIASTPEIICAYEPSWRPLEYSDEKSGEFSGVSADLFKIISRYTGLEFQFQEVSTPSVKASDSAPFEAKPDKDIQIITSLYNNYEWAQRQGMITTTPYLIAPIVMIRRNGSTANHRLALPTNHFSTERLILENPDKEIIFFDSINECFDAVKNGSVDITYTNTHVSDYMLSRPSYSGFAAATLSNFSDEICIGVSQSSDPLLFSIIEKSLASISSSELNEIIIKDTSIVNDDFMGAFIAENMIWFVTAAMVILLIIAGILSYALIMQTKSHKRIQELLYADPLTGGWNFNKFLIEAEKRIKASVPDKLIFIYTDINQFKMINDSYGFAEGDELLREFFHILKKNVSHSQNGECCARVAADQFVMLLSYTDWEDIVKRADTIDKEINQSPKVTAKAYHLIITFGAYIINNPHQDISFMLDLANYARRSGKAAHKSSVVLYDSHMRDEELVQRDLTNVMEKALANNEFVPYFQAKVNMLTGEIIGSEALARWVHPTKGLIPPASFIPYFERNGFITEIDFSIYRQVCALLKKRIDAGKRVLPISCNFSRLHIKNKNFAQKLKMIAEEYNVPTNLLELEITESVAMEDIESINSLIGVLKKMGFILAIDDFGAGYSSLGLLQRLNIDVLKLDRSFLQKGDREECEKIIIESIVSIGQKLNLSIICEGVETKEQAAMLMRIGCPLAQGFLYAKPIPMEDFEKQLDDNQAVEAIDFIAG